MKPLKNFGKLVKEGKVKIQTPNKSRANFLIQEAKKTHLFLKKLIKNFGVNNENSNSIIKLIYDIIMELIRARMLLNGFSTTGVGAHEAEVSYLKELGFSENEVQFADQLRYFRNGIIYYGKILDKEYAEKVLNFLNKIYSRLVNELGGKNV